MIRVQEVGVPKGLPKIDNVPDAYIKAAKKKIQAEPPEPKMKDGKPVEVFMYFFYFQGIPISWSLTFISRSTSNHDIYPLCRSRNVAGRGAEKWLETIEA